MYVKRNSGMAFLVVVLVVSMSNYKRFSDGLMKVPRYECEKRRKEKHSSTRISSCLFFGNVCCGR